MVVSDMPRWLEPNGRRGTTAGITRVPGGGEERECRQRSHKVDQCASHVQMYIALTHF